MLSVYVVVPTLNAVGRVVGTLESILQQRERGVRGLFVHLADGGSTDGTPEVAEQVLARGGVDYRVTSQPDRGMYDGLGRALELANRDVTCYLNAGDYWSRSCLSTVSRLMEETDASWLTGVSNWAAPDGAIIASQLPLRYRSQWLRRGVYGRILPHVQQESTFWRTELNGSIDFGRLKSLKLAGDSYMWARFAASAELRVVRASLAAWTMHGDHLSQLGYREEMDELFGELRLSDRLVAQLEKPMWFLPDGAKIRVAPRTIYYSRAHRRWVV